VFDEIGAELAADGENLVKKINGVFAFKVKVVKSYNNIVEAKWIVDAKNGKGKVEFDGEAEKVDATFQATDSDMFDLLSGKLNPQRAFLTEVLDIGLILDDLLHGNSRHVGVRAGQGCASQWYSGNPEETTHSWHYESKIFHLFRNGQRTVNNSFLM